MIIKKHGEQIGSYALDEYGNASIKCDWTKITKKEMMQLFNECSLYSLDEVATDEVVIDFQGDYPSNMGETEPTDVAIQVVFAP